MSAGRRHNGFDLPFGSVSVAMSEPCQLTTTGSTYSISASRGPVPVREPFKDKLNPSSERSLMMALLKLIDAAETSFWTTGGATAPMRYKAVSSV